MGTLADEERTFLLNATGLPADSTLSDLRYAYFKGVNDGTISSGVSQENFETLESSVAALTLRVAALENPTP